MRARSFLLSLMPLAGLLVFAGFTFATPFKVQVAERVAKAVEVDTELVLAVDVSYSMDPDEQRLQREGYMEALTSREFMSAIRSGMNGRIALTYFEWAGAFDQKVVLPWRLIEGPESADAAASEIGRAPYRRASRTSISGALAFAKPLFADSGFKGLRRVIDVSGDGPNNSGPVVGPVRDDVVAAGITINGLPVMINRPTRYSLDVENLDLYYEDCVIGGPGAFVIAVKERSQFREAIRTKLILEVAGGMPMAQVVPVQARKPRISCTIGEEQWRDRWGN